MPFLFNGYPVQRARITVPQHLVWTGQVTVAGVLDVAVGAAVTLVLGDTTFQGYVVAGGTFEGANESTYTVAGGSAGWTRPVIARGYNVPAGVQLGTVAALLAAEAGEQIDLGGVAGILGDHWERPAGPASSALSALFPLATGGWRVDPDGFARPGVRPPAPVPASVQLAVEDYSAARRWARIGLPDNTVSAVLPGAIITAGNLTTPIVVGETTIDATSERVNVEVLGEGGLVELFAAIVAAYLPPPMLTGIWTYQVTEADQGTLNLRALASAAGLPPVLACAKVFGVPGVTVTLAPGALVFVTFVDGSPAKPRVVEYDPSVPPLAVNIGGAGAVALVKDPALQTWVGKLISLFAGIGITVPVLTGEATTILKGV